MVQQQLEKWINEYLKDTDYSLQTLEIDKDLHVLVEVDRLGVVDVDFCAELNRYLVDKIESLSDTNFKDNYSLEVGSVSLTAPFKSTIQYQKHLGHNVVVTDMDGRRYSGQLVSVDEETFTVDADQTRVFRYDEVKQTIYNLAV